MSFWKRLFGSGEGAAVADGPRSYKEKDNRGTRHDRLSLATTYWMARMPSPKKDPFVMYIFDQASDAEAALLELPCIHLADDTKALICTEVLIFGYYKREDGKYEALVCGDDLTIELFEQAHASFAKHGGKKKNDLKPEKHAAPAQPAAAARPGKVVFVREDRESKMGKTMIYRIHKAPDAASAKAYLEEHPVTQPLYYIVIETPEGNYCRDIDGIYKE